jgi:hypothetical protein
MSANFLSTGLLSVPVKVAKADKFYVMLSDESLKGNVYQVDLICNPLYEDPASYLNENNIKPMYKLGWTVKDNKPVFKRLLADGTVDVKGTLSVDDKGINKLLSLIEKQVAKNPLMLGSLLDVEDLVNITVQALVATSIPLDEALSLGEDYLKTKIQQTQKEIAENWGFSTPQLTGNKEVTIDIVSKTA